MSLPDHGDQDDRVEHVNIANEIFRQHSLRSIHRDQYNIIKQSKNKIIMSKGRIVLMRYLIDNKETTDSQKIKLSKTDSTGIAMGGNVYARLQITIAEQKIKTNNNTIKTANEKLTSLRKYDRFYDQIPEHRDAQGYYGYIVALDINPATAETFLRIRNHFHRGVAPGISVFAGPPKGGMYSQDAKNLTIEKQQRYAGRRRVNSDMLGTQPATYFSPQVWNRRQQKNNRSILY